MDEIVVLGSLGAVGSRVADVLAGPLVPKTVAARRREAVATQARRLWLSSCAVPFPSRVVGRRPGGLRDSRTRRRTAAEFPFADTPVVAAATGARVTPRLTPDVPRGVVHLPELPVALHLVTELDAAGAWMALTLEPGGGLSVPG